MPAVGAAFLAKYDAAELASVETPASRAQAEAGNYRKAHLRAFGLDLAVENPKGSIRRKLTEDGEEMWRVEMPAHYGYIKGTTGADGDAVDCYLGPDESSDLVFVVDQIHPSDGSFDEHKCLLGFSSYEDAVKAYDAGFSNGSGPDRRGAVVEMTLAEFHDWLDSGETGKPVLDFAEQRVGKAWDESKHSRDQQGRFSPKIEEGAWRGKTIAERKAEIASGEANMKKLLDRADQTTSASERSNTRIIGAIKDPRIGPIDLVIGEPATADKKFNNGKGIDHIRLKRRHVDKLSDEEIDKLLQAIPRVIANGSRSGWTPRGDDEYRDRMTIETPKITVVLAKKQFGQGNPFVLTAYYNKTLFDVKKGSGPRWSDAPMAERSNLRIGGHWVVSAGGREAGPSISRPEPIGKAWIETNVVRDAIGRFTFKGGGRAAAVGAAAVAAVGLGALAARHLLSRSKTGSDRIINESVLWADHARRQADRSQRQGNPADAAYFRQNAKSAKDEPLPAHPDELGDKARLPSLKAAQPAADAIAALAGTKRAKWEQRADGLVIGAFGDDGVSTRSLYQDKTGALIARVDMIIRNDQGNGAVRNGLAKEIAAYRKMGVDRVTLHANIEIGAYAWARMGFVPGPNSWSVLKGELGRSLKLGVYSPAVKRQALKIINSDDPKGVWKIADMRAGERNIGKELLSGQHWFGALHLNDDQAMARFNAYITPPAERIAA